MQYYHDFSLLGLQLPQRPGIFAPNQAAKSPVISGYLLFCIGKALQREVQITFAELFCADAYYSFLASRFGVHRCDAFDSNRDGHLAEAMSIKRILGDERVNIHERNMFEMDPAFHATIVLNAGGLYHVKDPLLALELSYAMARRYLIIQSVTSLANEEVEYFETPCPGWKGGCRFSHAWLENEINKRRYFVVDSERNILPGNERPDDRGSSYFLIDTTRRG